MKHLFVLIHGLFGNPVHLTCLKTSFEKQFSPEESGIEVFVPATNAGFKSFDGVKLGAERIALEFDEFIKCRKEEDGVEFDTLSIVGYSLGGLYARYFIGILESRNYFVNVKPFMFTTFATPHVGSSFVSDSFHARVLNFLGGNVLGVSGNDLFSQGSTILRDMADPSQKFYKGLKKFKHLVLFANAIHDRTVPFFTAYISHKDPFQKRDFIDFVYFSRGSSICTSDSNSSEKGDVELLSASETDKPPFFIDMENSQYLKTSSGKEVGVSTQERQFQAFAVIALPWLFPILVMVTSITTIASHMRVREAERLALMNESTSSTIESSSVQSRRPSTASRRRSSFSESNRVAEWAGDAVDDILGPLENDDSNLEPQQLDSSVYQTENAHIRANKGNGYKGLLNSTPHELPLSDETLAQIEQLNKLPWEKFAVKLERMHSHAEIVNRRNKAGQGQEIVNVWVDMVSHKLKAASKS